MRWLLAIAVLTGCGAPSYSCRTTRGWRAFHAADCPGFQRAEDAIVAARPLVAAYLPWWPVSVVDGDDRLGFRDTWGQWRAGGTVCRSQTLVVTDLPWHRGALVHEVFHMLQCPDEDLTHATWTAETWHEEDRIREAAR